MKLSIIISNPEIGGAQRVSMNLAEWLSRSGRCDVTVIALSHRETNTYDMNKFNYHYLKSKSKIKELRQLLQNIAPDVVLTMGVPLCIYTVPATIGLPLKHVISERNDPTHFAGKKITTIVSRLFIKCADGYVFQTKDAQQFYGGNIACHSVIIPNPLFNLNKMPSSPYTGKREKIIVSVGRLNTQKNHSMLIRAFSSISSLFPDFKLEIWGEGGERAALEKLISELRLKDKVRLCGTSEDIFNCIYKSSLFVLASNFEGMPNALMEAMALGLPVISTDCPCGGPSFLIKNNINGVLIPVNGEKELSNSMIAILSDNKQVKSLSEEAFKIRKKFSEDIINEKWYKYLKSLK